MPTLLAGGFCVLCFFSAGSFSAAATGIGGGCRRFQPKRCAGASRGRRFRPKSVHDRGRGAAGSTSSAIGAGRRTIGAGLWRRRRTAGARASSGKWSGPRGRTPKFGSNSGGDNGRFQRCGPRSAHGSGHVYPNGSPQCRIGQPQDRIGQPNWALNKALNWIPDPYGLV